MSAGTNRRVAVHRSGDHGVVHQSVVVTDGGDGQNRSAVAAVRALAAAGYLPVVTTSGQHNLAASSRDCAVAVEVPTVDDPGYRAAVKETAAVHGAIAVLPASDGALVALGLPSSVLVDKTQLGRLAAAAGFPELGERRFTSVAELRSAKGLEFPIVVKAEQKVGGAAFEAKRVDGPKDLGRITATAEVPVVVQPFVAGSMRAVCGVMWRGEMAAVVHQRYERLWPSRCGVASAAVVAPRDHATEQHLRVLLANHDGIFQAQLIGNHLIDLNPRVYGSLPLAVAAGVNLPAIWCGLLERPDDPTPPTVSGRVGLRYRWVEGDLRSLWSAFRMGEAGLASTLDGLVPHRHTAHSIESLRDPLPMIGRGRYALRRSQR